MNAKSEHASLPDRVEAAAAEMFNYDARPDLETWEKDADASPSLGDDTPLKIGQGQNWYWSCGECGWVGINLPSRSAAENESARHECPRGDVHREERT